MWYGPYCCQGQSRTDTYGLPSEITIVLVALAICVGAVIVMFKLAGHFAARPPVPRGAEWIDSISAETEKLCRLTPFRGQLAFPIGMAKDVRLERCRQWRAHLQSLQNNFEEVCTAVKLINTESPTDRPDLTRALLRNQWTFACRLMAARIRVAGYRYGVGR